MPFMSKSFQIGDHFFPLLFPKDSENFKSFDIGFWEVGAQRRLNGVNKWENPLKKLFLLRRLYTLLWAKVFKSETTSFHYLFQKSKKFWHWTSGSEGKNTVKQSGKHQYQQNPAQKNKICPKTIFFSAAILHPSVVKFVNSETSSFHYFSPRIPSLKNF